MAESIDIYRFTNVERVYCIASNNRLERCEACATIGKPSSPLPKE